MNTPPETVNEAQLAEKLRSIPRNVSVTIMEKAIMLYVILMDKQTPAWARVLVLTALVYFINPFDAIPDAVPFFGYTDDIALMAFTLERLSRLITPDMKQRVKERLPFDKKCKTTTSESSGNKRKEG